MCNGRKMARGGELRGCPFKLSCLLSMLVFSISVRVILSLSFLLNAVSPSCTERRQKMAKLLSHHSSSTQLALLYPRRRRGRVLRRKCDITEGSSFFKQTINFRTSRTLQDFSLGGINFGSNDDLIDSFDSFVPILGIPYNEGNSLFHGDINVEDDDLACWKTNQRKELDTQYKACVSKDSLSPVNRRESKNPSSLQSVQNNETKSKRPNSSPSALSTSSLLNLLSPEIFIQMRGNVTFNVPSSKENDATPRFLTFPTNNLLQQQTSSYANSTNDAETSDSTFNEKCIDPMLVYEINNDDDNLDDDNLNDDIIASDTANGENRYTWNVSISTNDNHETSSAVSSQLSWLNEATSSVLDFTKYPLGSLTPDDMEVIRGLMSSWPRYRSLHAALQVELLLKRVVQDMEHDKGRDNRSAAYVSSRMYTYAIDAWAKSGAKGRAHRAQRIHDTMVKMYNETGNALLAPSTVSYNALINAWCKAADECDDAPEKVELILSDMLQAMKHAELHHSLNLSTTSTDEYRQTATLVDDISNNSPIKETIRKIKWDDFDCNDEILSSYESDRDTFIRPDAITIATILDTYARCSSVHYKRVPPAHVRRCEELFEMMNELRIKKNSYTYSALQNIYAKSGSRDAPDKAMAVLEEMIALYNNDGDLSLKPNAINYNAVLNALSRTPSKSNAKRAIELLHKMELPANVGGYDVEPDRLSYAVTILCCARCPDEVFAAKAAEDSLRKMELRAQYEADRRAALSSAAPAAVTLDVECYNVVLTALSRCKQPNAPNRAIDIIQRMDNYVRNGIESVRANIRSWNAVLNVFARASGTREDRDFAEKSEAILNRLIHLHDSGVPNIKPNAFTYAAVLSAYQRADDPNAAHRVDEIVRRMEEEYESGKIDTCPDTYHYTILCGTWAKSNCTIAPARVLQILSHMMERERAGYPNVRPNTRTLNAVLDCLSRQNEEKRAEELLFYMLKKFKDGHDYLKPDAFSFNCVIQGFLKSTQFGSGKRAEQILERLIEYAEQENRNVRPDYRSFTHIIQYYTKKSNEPDAMYRANYILSRMFHFFKAGQKELLPSSYICMSVMDCYSYRSHPDSGNNADHLLNQMRQLIREYGVSKNYVNTAVMNSVLFAWSSSGDTNAGPIAENYLNYMEQSFLKGMIHLQPDSRTYVHVISAWSKSGDADKAQRALKTLQRMEAQSALENSKVVVDEHAYSLVINTCAFSNFGPEVEQEAFKIAVTVMDKILENEGQSPLSLTFGWFIQACGRLCVNDELKNFHIERAFLACCRRGLVNDFVLQRLEGAASESLYQKLIGSGVHKSRQVLGTSRQLILWSLLPLEWKRNVVRRRPKIPNN